MNYQVTGINSTTSQKESVVVAACSISQARRFCSGYYGMKSIRVTTAKDSAELNNDFSLVQQFLSVQQYRKVRKARGCSQFPSMDVLLNR